MSFTDISIHLSCTSTGEKHNMNVSYAKSYPDRFDLTLKKINVPWTGNFFIKNDTTTNF